jgi:internalin A
MSSNAPTTDSETPPRNVRSKRLGSWLIPRFSLRTILIVITLVCLAMGLPYSRAERQRTAATTLLQLNCYWDFEPEPKWLQYLPPYVRNFRDGHYFRSVVKVTVNSQARHSLNTIFYSIGQIDRMESIDCQYAPVTHEHLTLLSRLRNVKSLHIHHRLIDDGALASLRNWTGLEELLIPGAGVTSQGVAQLQRNSRLRRIDLSNTLVGDEIAEVLHSFSLLEYLELRRTDITPSGFARFPDFAEVTWVDLGDTLVDDEVVKKLARFPKLTGIDLAGTRITDFTGMTLARWPLNDIRLNETVITDATLDALTETTTLESLDVRDTKVTLFGVRRLHTLPNIGSVSYSGKISFKKNELQALAGKHAQSIDGLEISKRLSRAEWELMAKFPIRRYLSVEGSNCDDETLELLTTNVNLDGLGLRGCAIGSRGLAAVAKLPKLNYVDLANTPVTALDLAVFQGHDRLQGLNISDTKLGDDVMPTILSLPNFRSLSVTRGQLSYDSLKQLHEKKIHLNIEGRTMMWSELGDYSDSHEYLIVPGSWTLTRARIEAIAAESHLRSLNLQEQSIDDAAWTQFSPLNRLTHIAIRGKGVTDKTLEDLATRMPLYWLKLIDCNVTSEGLMKLANLPNLRHLHITDVDLRDDGVAFLEQLPKLEGLTLVGTKISDASLPRIAGLTGLKYLDLNRTDVTPTAVRDVLASSKIDSLLVGGSFLSDGSLRFLRNLDDSRATSVDLNGPCFDDKVLTKLADYVWLREVDLANSSAGDATLQAINGLTDLQIVELKGTQITDDGLRHMARWKHLRRLDLSDTAITDEGLKQIMALPQLRKIWLQGTRVSPKAVEALREKYPWVTIISDRLE